MIKNFDVQDLGLVHSFTIHGNIAPPTNQKFATLQVLSGTHVRLDLAGTALAENVQTQQSYPKHSLLNQVSIKPITENNQLSITLFFRQPTAVSLLQAAGTNKLELVFRKLHQNLAPVKSGIQTVNAPQKLLHIGVLNTTQEPERQQRFIQNFSQYKPVIHQKFGMYFEIVRLDLPKQPLPITTIYYTEGNEKIAIGIARLIKGDQHVLKIKTSNNTEDIHVYLGNDY